MPLTDKQRRHLERRLREERKRVLETLARYDQRFSATEQDESGDLSKAPFHMADEGTDTMQRELDASLASRTGRELEDIDDALRKLYHDPARYGICESTGREIPFARLDIIPWARTCELHP